ncbi:MAG: hypothetical protein IKY67_06280 [Paludibacteraceae bacterium]|nr:hypothetical protein [Paludibacteraceae bacterium]
MAVKYKTVKNDFPKMEQSLNMLDDRKVNVGHLDGGEQAWLAAIHEYGCNIKVTDKMRAWLHRNGLHIKNTTTEIIIPERSFLRSGFDTYHEKVIKLNEAAFAECLANGDVEEYLQSVGETLVSKIKDYAVDLKEPPKHPFTLQRDPSKTNPLINSGDMIGALTYEVE